MKRREVSNIGTAEAQDIQRRSEFIKRIYDFAQYMQKEYVDGDDGDLAMMICAVDRTVGDGKSATAHIAMGGNKSLTLAVSSTMQQEPFAEIFRNAGKVSGSVSEDRRNIDKLRRHLRIGYVYAGFVSLWVVLVIFLQVVGMANWITTISCMLLMLVIVRDLYSTLRGLRLRIKRVELEEKREYMERIENAVGAVTSFLDEMAERMSDDDDDDDE